MLKNKGKLILTRKSNESFIIKLADHVNPSTPIGEIFDDIEVSLINSPGQVKIAIEADQSFDILRSELLET